MGQGDAGGRRDAGVVKGRGERGGLVWLCGEASAREAVLREADSSRLFT